MSDNRMRYSFLFLCFSVVLYMGCQPIQIGQPGAMSSSSPPITKSGELAGDEAWSGNIIVESDVVVPEDSSLTIDSGAMVKFSRDTKLVVNGTLFAEGQINNPITLTSAELEPKPGDWNGIVFTESSLNSRLQYCVLHFHKAILCSSDSLRISNSMIAEGTVAGVVCKASSPTIEDSMITKNGVGIRCEDTASPVISHNAITANMLDGIECNRGSYATISYNMIGNNRKNGISCYSGASPEINFNNIIYNGGWAVYGGGKMTSNFIQGNKEQGMEAIDTSDSLSGDQHYGVENVDSPRSSRVPDAGVRKEERW
jgi:hypothetical protein